MSAFYWLTSCGSFIFYESAKRLESWTIASMQRQIEDEMWAECRDNERGEVVIQETRNK